MVVHSSKVRVLYHISSRPGSDVVLKYRKSEYFHKKKGNFKYFVIMREFKFCGISTNYNSTLLQKVIFASFIFEFLFLLAKFAKISLTKMSIYTVTFFFMSASFAKWLMDSGSISTDHPGFESGTSSVWISTGIDFITHWMICNNNRIKIKMFSLFFIWYIQLF